MASVDEPVFVSAPELPPGPRNALVIATSRYDDTGLRQLRSPVRDAEDFAAVLADPATGGFKVTELIDQTESRIRREIAVFLDERGADETILLYLSCHGIQDRRGRLYFAATDTIGKYPHASAVRAAELLDGLDECRARRQIVVLDCCFSGSFGDNKGGKGELDLERQLRGHSRGREILTASRGFEYSFEGEPLDGVVTGSVFTTGLVEGLRTGAADSDRNGHITVEEAYGYAFAYVQKNGSPQTPQHWLFSGEGNKIVLARSAAGRAVTPAKLPEDLVSNLESRHPDVRIGAVNAIARWLADPDPTRVLAAGQALQEIADFDIRRVAEVAGAHLGRLRPALDAPPPLAAQATSPSRRQVDMVVKSVPSETSERASFDKNWIPSTVTAVLEGHTSSVRRVVFSSDGMLVATAGADRTVRIWSDATDEHRVLRGHTDWVRGVAFSPDQNLLVSAADDGTVCMWNPVTGDQLGILEGHTGYVWSVAFSPDSALLASASGDGTVRVWNAATGKQLRVLGSGEAAVRGVAFSPDGALLASANGDGKLRVWNAETGDHLRSMGGHVGRIRNVAFSPAGMLASAGEDGTVRTWDAATGRDLRIGKGHVGVVQDVAFSPREQLLASAGDDGTVRFWR